MKTKEELKNKYIKYDSSITEEIFNKIISKLKSLGFKEYSGNNNFKDFSDGAHCYLKLDGDYTYYLHCSFHSAEEIKVSDILGEETKFEVGKWYSFYWNWSSGYCIGKVCQVNTYEKTVIKFDNYTSNNSPGKLFTDGRTIYLAEIENIKELSLEEIQQYLPDNHPDKIVKPIEKWSVGSYVVFLQEYGRSNKGTIDVIKEFDYSSSASSLEKEGIAPGYLDGEINNYLKWFATLPEAEAFSKSLLEPEESKPKLKIGDYVITNRYSSCYNGRILRITKFSDRYPDIAYFEVFDDGYYSKNDNFSLDKVERFATSEEIAKVTKPEPKESKEFDRNWYVEVSSQEEADKVFEYLESIGESVVVDENNNRKYLPLLGGGKGYRYIYYIDNEWFLGENPRNRSQKQLSDILPEYRQPIKTGPCLREQILQNQYQYKYKTINSSSVWETPMNPPIQNSTINLKQEPIKLLSFEEDNVVLFKTNSVKISNKQLIIND